VSASARCGSGPPSRRSSTGCLLCFAGFWKTLTTRGRQDFVRIALANGARDARFFQGLLDLRQQVFIRLLLRFLSPHKTHDGIAKLRKPSDSGQSKRSSSRTSTGSTGIAPMVKCAKWNSYKTSRRVTLYAVGSHNFLRPVNAEPTENSLSRMLNRHGTLIHKSRELHYSRS
jgi:hypothetical protein